jgi:hypothetical protein
MCLFTLQMARLHIGLNHLVLKEQLVRQGLLVQTAQQVQQVLLVLKVQQDHRV